MPKDDKPVAVKKCIQNQAIVFKVENFTLLVTLFYLAICQINVTTSNQLML